MKLLSAAVVPLSSLLISFADGAVYRLRGHHGGNETKMIQYYPPPPFAGPGPPSAPTAPSDHSANAGASDPAPQPPTMFYKTLKYSGDRLDVNDPQAFVDAIEGSESTSGYCEKNMTEASWKNTDTCTGGTYAWIAYQFSVEFENHIGSNWHFNFGVDFGLGGVIYMDGVEMNSYAGDIWWSMSENHANYLGFGTFLPKGRHVMKVYGAESCCDGPSRIKFCANCETYENMELLTIANLEKAVDHFMEVGSFAPELGEQFHAFNAVFETPPVVVISGGATGEIKVRQVTSSGFSAKVGATQASDKVMYLAVEPGVHLLPDGRTIEAGSTTWNSPYNDHTFDLSHDFGLTPPAFNVTWVGSSMAIVEATEPGSVASQLAPKQVTLSMHDSRFHGYDTIGYVAMAKGEGQVYAKGHSLVNYNTTLGLFEWSDSFVV